MECCPLAAELERVEEEQRQKRVCRHLPLAGKVPRVLTGTRWKRTTRNLDKTVVGALEVPVRLLPQLARGRSSLRASLHSVVQRRHRRRRWGRHSPVPSAGLWSHPRKGKSELVFVFYLNLDSSLKWIAAINKRRRKSVENFVATEFSARKMALTAGGPGPRLRGELLAFVFTSLGNITEITNYPSDMCPSQWNRKLDTRH